MNQKLDNTISHYVKQSRLRNPEIMDGHSEPCESEARSESSCDTYASPSINELISALEVRGFRIDRAEHYEHLKWRRYTVFGEVGETINVSDYLHGYCSIDSVISRVGNSYDNECRREEQSELMRMRHNIHTMNGPMLSGMHA